MLEICLIKLLKVKKAIKESVIYFVVMLAIFLYPQIESIMRRNNKQNCPFGVYTKFQMQTGPVHNKAITRNCSVRAGRITKL